VYPSVRTTGNERHANSEVRAVDDDPLVKFDAVAVPEPDVEQRPCKVVALGTRLLRGAHAVDRHDSKPVRLEPAPDDFADHFLVLDVQNRHLTS